MKTRLIALVVLLCMVFSAAPAAQAEQIPPAYPVPEYVTWLLNIARSELGYTEKPDGTTKYGEWVNNPQAQWCAEFLCWSVDQVDQAYQTNLLKNIYPLYGATNIGLNWFLREGRYLARSGFVNAWGSQWYLADGEPIAANSYVPQPGDWVFFSYTPSGDTTHVAMVEFCSREADGLVKVHVLEGNNPDKVQQAVYDITDWRILGYGTVHDVAGIVLRGGNEGTQVKRLQEKLVILNLLTDADVTGTYSQRTSDAVRAFQSRENQTATGIANRQTQLAINAAVDKQLNERNQYWVVDNSR